MSPPAAKSGIGLLTGRAYLVTGSSSGIGREVALAIAAAGGDVLVHCRQSVTSGQNVAAQIRGLGRTAALLQGDLAEEGTSERLIEEAWTTFPQLDGVVLLAGADVLTGDAAQRSFQEKLDLLWRVDVQGTMRMARAAGARFRAQGGGVIVTCGWDQAATGMEGDSGELFAATKGAVMSFTRSLAVSLAPQVRVNCVAPGWIQTAWGAGASEVWQRRVLRETPLQRWGTPADIAGMVTFLLSDQASFLTGQVLNVNGGVVR